MNFRFGFITLLMTTVVLGGCAKTEVTDRTTYPTGKLPKPDRVWVYNFAATPSEIPVHTGLDKEYLAQSPPQTSEHIAYGKKLGAEIQEELVTKLREMGMLAEHAVAGSNPQLNDLVIQGYILSYDEGDAKKRVAIGLGKGASKLHVAVEGLQKTVSGFKVLGSGEMGAKGDKTPGGAVGLAVLAVTKNPAGLLVSTGMHAYGEHTGSSTVEGRAKQTADEIAELLESRFKEQGWL